MGGGGSSSSRVQHSAYLESIHSYMLWGVDITGTASTVYNRPPGLYSFVNALEKAVRGEVDINSPYYDSSISGPLLGYDPTTDLAAIATEISEFDDMIDELYDDAVIDNQVNDFSTRTEQSHLLGINRIAMLASAAECTDGSAFIWANVMHESERERSVEAYRHQLTHDARLAKISSKERSVAFHVEYRRTNIVAFADEIDHTAIYKAKCLSWDLELFRDAGNLLGSIGGSALPDTQKPNRLGSALSGALGGASLMASAGAKGGVLAGTALGGGLGLGVGAVLGGLAGFLTSR